MTDRPQSYPAVTIQAYMRLEAKLAEWERRFKILNGSSEYLDREDFLRMHTAIIYIIEGIIIAMNVLEHQLEANSGLPFKRTEPRTGYEDIASIDTPDN